MIKRNIIFTLIFLFATFTCYGADSISARSYVVMEQSLNKVLMAKNENVRMKPASTTKILTAICALEEGNLSDMVTASYLASSQEGSSIYLKKGDKLSLENMVYGLMLNSGNDAAVAISEHIKGNVEKFASLMNKKAKEIGAKNSNFTNPNGLDHPDHYVTAYDLALITSYALNCEKFSEIVKTKTKVINGENGFKRFLTNHNRMLNQYEGCIGVKTGFTKKSGRTLVTAAEKDGIKLIVVTLNAPDDWRDHEKLLNEGFLRVKKERIIEKDSIAGYSFVKDAYVDKVDVRFKEDFYGVLIDGKNDYSIECKFDKLKAPIKTGDKAGEAVVKINNKEIYKCDLVASKEIERTKKATYVEYLKKVFRVW